MTIADETLTNRDTETAIAADECYNCNQIKSDYEAYEANQPLISESAIEEEKPATLYRAAGFWIRMLASVIDLGVIACLNAIIWDAVLPVGIKQTSLYELIQTNTLFLGLTGITYFILMTHYFRQTLGKMITGIQVIQRSGQPLSWTTVIFRELVGRSLSQLMGLNLGYIFCWFNSDKRCLHDFLSDTWVVHVNPQSHAGYIAVKGQIT
mgnify:CR=1 FL=1